MQKELVPRSLMSETLNLLLMMQILHYLKDPKLWELWYIPYYMQDYYHQS